MPYLYKSIAFGFMPITMRHKLYQEFYVDRLCFEFCNNLFEMGPMNFKLPNNEAADLFNQLTRDHLHSMRDHSMRVGIV